MVFEGHKTYWLFKGKACLISWSSLSTFRGRYAELSFCSNLMDLAYLVSCHGQCSRSKVTFHVIGYTIFWSRSDSGPMLLSR